MLIVQGKVTINLKTCVSFICDDCPHDKYKFQINFLHVNGNNDLLIFVKEENRDKAYQDILFAYAEGKKIFAIINQKGEE